MPDRSGFVGFGGERVSAPPQDYVTLDLANGVTRFEEHFHAEGRRHADKLTRELLMAPLLFGKLDLVDYTDAIARFGPAADHAQECYATGLCDHLATNGDVLRGIVALRDLHLQPHYDQATVAASDLPRDLCLAVADKLSELSRKLSRAADVRLPLRLQPPANPVATRHESATAEPNRKTDNLLTPPPGTAAARHASTARHHPGIGSHSRHHNK